MLREVLPVAQVDGESPRRWFADSYFDLIVWADVGGGLSAFHLSYDKRGLERLLDWRRGGRLSHFRVDRADTRPARYGRAAILVAEEPEAIGDVVDRFRDAASGVQAPVVGDVLRALEAELDLQR